MSDSEMRIGGRVLRLGDRFDHPVTDEYIVIVKLDEKHLL